MDKCQRILLFRWMVLMVAVCELSYLIFWLTVGRLPSSNTIRTVADSKDPTSPLLVSRLLDPLALVIPIVLLVWIFMWIKSKPRTNRTYSNKYERMETAMIWGLPCGFFGTFIIGGCGFAGLLAGTIITVAVIFVVGWVTITFTEGAWKDRNRYLEIVWVILTACLVIWALLTLFDGLVAGSLYAVTALAVASVVYFGLWAIGFVCWWIFARSGGTFYRFMLTCPTTSEDC